MKKMKQDIYVIIRSLKEIRRISPGHLGLILLQAVFTALSPFVTLYLSTQILNGIVNQAEPRQLFFYAAATLTAGLAVHLLTSFFKHLLNQRQYRFWPVMIRNTKKVFLRISRARKIRISLKSNTGRSE